MLADQEQALEQEVAEAASPSRLAERAEALGMVRSENPAFIRLSDGARPRQAQAGGRAAAASRADPERLAVDLGVHRER